MDKYTQQDAKILKYKFNNIYPLYVQKISAKGRSIEELNTIIKWLTGYTDDELQYYIDHEVSLKDFFDKASIHPNAHMIKGTICGYKIELIETPLTKYVRYMDKLVDELAKGKVMEKILRS